MENKRISKYGYQGDPRFKPLTPWAYFGYNLLLGIPIVGLVFAFIFAFSSKNINRRNFVRSFFIVYIIYAILIVIIILTVGSLSEALYLLSRMS